VSVTDVATDSREPDAKRAGAVASALDATPIFGSEADEPSRPEELPAPAVALPQLTFGQPQEAQSESEEAPGAPSHFRRNVALTFVAVVALVLAGYAIYVRSIPNPEASLVPAASAPVKQVGEPAVALPEPVALPETMPAPPRTGANGGIRTDDGTSAATPTEPPSPAGPPSTSPDPSAQLPENRNQVN